jgi:hypothetical protein
MSRPVSLRPSYRDDAAFLLRLEAAVGKDERQSSAWRIGTQKLLRKISVRLLEADAQKNMGDDEGADKRRKTRRRASAAIDGTESRV